MVEKEDNFDKEISNNKNLKNNEDIKIKSYESYTIRGTSNELEIKSLKEKITNDTNNISKMKAEEKYRRMPVGRDVVFPIEDFIDFKVEMRSKNKTLKLKTYLFLPSKEDFPCLKGLVFLFHGMQAHSNNGAILSEKLIESGLAIAAFDFRGHGNSEGISGNIEKFEYILQDCREFMEQTISFFKNDFFKNSKYFKTTLDDKTNNKEKLDEEENEINKKKYNFLENIFIGGLSMGGLVSFHLAHESPKRFKGVLFFAPAFDMWQGCLMKTLIKLINCCYSSFEIPRSTEPIAFKNPESFDNPDLIIYNTRVKVQTVKTMLEYMEKSQKNFNTFETPYIIVIPGVDKLVPPLKMLEFFEKSISKDKEIWYYDNLWHAIYIEEEMYEIRNRIKSWIEKRIS